MNNQFSASEITFYEEILNKFPGEKRRKSKITADVLCTVHDDHNPSLGVDLGQNGAGARVLINCRSQGCDCAEILRVVGLTIRDLYFNKPSGKSKKVSVPGAP